MAFWTCPNCGRRVPGYQPSCHCGVARTASSALPPPPTFGQTRFSWSSLPWPVWAAFGVILLAFGYGVWQLFRPSPSERIVPLLGVIDPLPSSTPKPSPRPSPSPSQQPR